MRYGIYDWLGLLSCLVFAVEAGLHAHAGRALFLLGTPTQHYPDDCWTPETPKQQLLVGVFFVTSLAWLHALVLTAAIIVAGNPLGGWLGVVNVLFTLPQLAMVLRDAGWSRIGIVAGSVFLFHSSVFAIYAAHAFLH